MKEVWKDVDGYEGMYQVSNLGRIRSKKQGNEWRIMKPTKNRYGNMEITLCRNGKRLGLVHRLVAAAFCNGYSKELTVVHINGVRDDNRAANLRWVTRECLPLHNLHVAKAYRDSHPNPVTTGKEEIFSLPDDIEGEEWRDIEDYEGMYMVSNKGRVFSLRRHIILRQHPNVNSGGHLCVLLFKDSHGKKMQVHRLVAMAFIEGYRPGLVVNHKDENPRNNNVENLEWTTIQENLKYGTARERSTAGYIAKRGKPVSQYTLDGQFIRSYITISEAARLINIKGANEHIANCCNGKREEYKGYRWKWAKKTKEKQK